MSIEEKEGWITGDEFGRERRRLIAAGVPDDAPEFQELLRRVDERDDYLYERYGKPYRATHEGNWIAVSLHGQVIIHERPGEVSAEARRVFGPGNFSLRKLAEFPGFERLS